MYECHLLGDAGYYLKSRSSVVRLVSCLPKFNKGMKDDFLIVSGEWLDGLYCPVQEGELGKVPRFRSLLSFFLHRHWFLNFVALSFPLVIVSF